MSHATSIRKCCNFIIRYVFNFRSADVPTVPVAPSPAPFVSRHQVIPPEFLSPDSPPAKGSGGQPARVVLHQYPPPPNVRGGNSSNNGHGNKQPQGGGGAQAGHASGSVYQEAGDATPEEGSLLISSTKHSSRA